MNCVHWRKYLSGFKPAIQVIAVRSLCGLANGQVWSRLSAQDEGCSTFRCASEMDGACPYYRARKRAETAHIVITNHALLIADAKIENRALPDYQNLIVDEAHHLEDAITNGLSRRIDQTQILTRLATWEMHEAVFWVSSLASRVSIFR